MADRRCAPHPSPAPRPVAHRPRHPDPLCHPEGAQRLSDLLISIRQYQPDVDGPGIRDCIVELQEFERGLEPSLPPGESMSDDYLAYLTGRCRECDGTILIAFLGDTLAGFVCVLASVPPEEPDEARAAYACVSDLVVRAEHRKRGLGRRLLEEAELLARARGAVELRIGVLARNRAARELYAAFGFAELRVELTKPI